MTLNLYTVRDTYGVSYDQSVVTAPTDGAAARMFAGAKGVNLNELTLYRIGTYDCDTGIISGTAPLAISWSVYSRPEIAMTPITNKEFDETKQSIS